MGIVFIRKRKKMNDSNRLRMTVYTSLFVAFIAIGAFIAIPVGPVPIVLQNMFVLLAGIIWVQPGALPVWLFIF